MVTHPLVVAALSAEDLSESYGRAICQWTDKLPEDCRPAADAILLSAAMACAIVNSRVSRCFTRAATTCASSSEGWPSSTT